MNQKYCWEIYNKSECEACPFFKSYSEGNLDIEKHKDIILIEEEPS